MQNSFYPVYVLLGENENKKQKIVKNLVQRVLNNEINEFNYNIIYADSTEPKEVINIAETFSFLGGNKLVILKNFDNYSNTDKKIIAEYSKNPAPSTCLIIIENTRANKTLEWYKIFDEQKQNVEVQILWEYKYTELVQIIADTFKEYKKKSDYAVCEALASLLENSQNAIDSEIKKIVDYAQDKDKISLDDIKENIKKDINNDNYELAKTITSGNKARSIMLLNNFAPKELKYPQLILFVITDRFIKILKYLTLLDEGMDYKQAQKTLGIMAFLDPEFHKHAKRYDISKLTKIFDSLIDLDFKLKTSYVNTQILLEEFILEC